eukprot:1820139-Amphidinium_carterae.1
MCGCPFLRGVIVQKGSVLVEFLSYKRFVFEDSMLKRRCSTVVGGGLQMRLHDDQYYLANFHADHDHFDDDQLHDAQCDDDQLDDDHVNDPQCYDDQLHDDYVNDGQLQDD